MEVVILAGGYATRLHGIWDGPKCLVPLAGVPLLSRLLRKVDVLRPKKVTLCLGHLSHQVLKYLGQSQPTLRTRLVTDSAETPKGTVDAILRLGKLSSPLLVLNGDTYPLYSLAHMMDYAEVYQPLKSVVLSKNKDAGAYLFKDLRDVKQEPTTKNIEDLFSARSAFVYGVPGFLDVGTPEGFQIAQNTKEEEL